MFIFEKMIFRMTVRILVDIKFAWWITVHLTWLFMAFITLLGISLIPSLMFLLYFFFLQNHNKDNHTRKKNYYKNRAIDDSHRVNWRISQQHSIWLIHACAGTRDRWWQVCHWQYEFSFDCKKFWLEITTINWLRREVWSKLLYVLFRVVILLKDLILENKYFIYSMFSTSV